MKALEMKKRLEAVPDDFEMDFHVKLRGDFATVTLAAKKEQACYLIRVENVNVLENYPRKNTKWRNIE